LRKYLPDEEEFLPFVRDLPKDSTSAKIKAKAGDAKAPQAAKQAVEAGAGVAQTAPVEDKVKDLKLNDK
jgi:hypothetical protein